MKSSFKKIFALLFLFILLLTSKGISAAADVVRLTNPLSGLQCGDAAATAVPCIVGKIINGVLGVVGIIALVYFIYGGILWMTSGGNEQQVKQGKDTLVWAIFGLVIVFFSYALSNFIIGILTKGAG